MKAERTMRDELGRVRALRRNPAVQGEEDARLLGAQAALEWAVEGGPPPVYCCISREQHTEGGT
jgi:hypothetical protein